MQARADSSVGSASGGHALRDGLLVAALALLVLLLHAGLYDPSRLHLGWHFSDQAGYVTTARILVDQRELRSGLTFPAYAHLGSWRLYMPGHYVTLALAYSVFGYGVFSSLLPSLIAFVASALLCRAIAARLYGRAAGLIAAGLFLSFPAYPLYAFTAMAELSFTCACLVAVWAFLVTPEPRRPWLLPLCLLLPFCFRETGALIVVPLAACMLGGSGERRMLRAGAAVGAATLVCYACLQWQLASGKVAIPLNFMLEGSFNFGSTIEAPPSVSPGDWLAAFGRNFTRNLSETGAQWSEGFWRLQGLGLAWILALWAFVALRGIWRRNAFELGTAGMFGLLALVVYGMYDVQAQKALRSFLFALPLLLVVGSSALAAARGRVAVVLGVVLVPALLWGSATIALRAGESLLGGDAVLDEGEALLENLALDDDQLVLVHPYLFNQTIGYAVSHYPVPFGITPTDDATFRRIDAVKPVGSVIVSLEPLRGQEPPRRHPSARHLRLQRIFQAFDHGVPYALYRTR